MQGNDRTLMKLPYGESNFKKVITQGYTYIDKTDYIAKLEAAGSYHILLRPRRFGKSLFLSMLWHYYDVYYRAEFDTLFDKLYIGQHPTPLKSSYPVLFTAVPGQISLNPSSDAILMKDLHSNKILKPLPDAGYRLTGNCCAVHGIHVINFLQPFGFQKTSPFG
jgi:hypothetical protein